MAMDIARNRSIPSIIRFRSPKLLHSDPTATQTTKRMEEMPNQRQIDIYSAGCAVCEEAVQMVKDLACPSCNITIKDDSGEVKMTLWNEQVEQVDIGDKIHLKNGWCSEIENYTAEISAKNSYGGRVKEIFVVSFKNGVACGIYRYNIGEFKISNLMKSYCECS